MPESPQHRFDPIFHSIARFGLSHSKKIVLLVLVFLIVSPFLLKDLRFEFTSTVQAVPHDSITEIYRGNLDRFGDSGPLIIRITRRGVDGESIDHFTDRLVEELSLWRETRFVDARPFSLDDGPVARARIRAALLNAGADSLARFALKFDGQEMRRELMRTRGKIIAAADPKLRSMIAADPLNIRELLLPVYESWLGKIKFSENSEYFDSSDGRFRLIFLHPDGLSEDTGYSTALVSRINSLLTGVRSERPGFESIRVDLTGKYAITAEASLALKQDLGRITIVACLLILLLMWFVFRSVRAILIGFLPLALASVAVFVFARLFFGPLNYVSMTFAPIILGLGIDTMLHCTGRFFQRMRKSESFEISLSETLADCGPPVCIGVITTAGAFICLLFAKFGPLRQFALLTAAGLVIALVICIGLFPVVVKLFSSGAAVPGGVRFQQGPARLFGWSFKHPFPLIGLGLLLVLGSTFVAGKFRFEMDLFKGLPENLESMQTALELADSVGVSFILNTQLTIAANDLETAMTFQRELDLRLQDLVRSGSIASFLSPAMYLAYPAADESRSEPVQMVRRRIIQNRDRFFELIKELRFRRGPEIEQYYPLLVSLFAADKTADENSERGELASRLAFLTAAEKDRVYLQTYIWPYNDLADYSGVKTIAAGFQNLKPPAGTQFYVSGTYQLFEHLNRLVKNDFLRVSLFSLIAVALIVFFFFRNPLHLLLVLSPILAAIPLTIAVLVISGYSFTPSVIGMIALVVGIGIDDAVHVLTRVRLQGQSASRLILVEIGPILCLTTISTMIGFGALILSSFYSISTMGLTIALGVFFCLFATLTFIPPALRLMEGKNR